MNLICPICQGESFEKQALPNLNIYICMACGMTGIEMFGNLQHTMHQESLPEESARLQQPSVSEQQIINDEFFEACKDDQHELAGLLEAAVEFEDYLFAARLRDRIKEIKNQ